MHGKAVEAWLATGRDVLKAAREIRRYGDPLFDAMLEDFVRLGDGTDALICSLVALASWQVAARRRIPCFAALLQPVTPTRDFPAIGLPAGLRLGGAFNIATHRMARQMFWLPFRRRMNRWRQERLGLPPLPVRGPFELMSRYPVHTLYGFSEHVVRRPRDWSEHTHVTGYWFLDAPTDWTPPPALEDFLAAGDPPVYIGFGSMTPRHAERLTAIALEALDRTGQRGILLGGWGGFGEGALPSSVLRVEDVPHSWLFPRMRAVVGHGGAGTTAASLRAGVPTVVLPLFGDQLYWANRVYRLGVGPRPIRRARLTGARLAHRINTAVEDSRMRARASELGALIRAEDGVAMAVEIIAATLKAGRDSR